MNKKIVALAFLFISTTLFNYSYSQNSTSEKDSFNEIRESVHLISFLLTGIKFTADINKKGFVNMPFGYDPETELSLVIYSKDKTPIIFLKSFILNEAIDSLGKNILPDQNMPKLFDPIHANYANDNSMVQYDFKFQTLTPKNDTIAKLKGECVLLLKKRILTDKSKTFTPESKQDIPIKSINKSKWYIGKISNKSERVYVGIDEVITYNCQMEIKTNLTLQEKASIKAIKFYDENNNLLEFKMKGYQLYGGDMTYPVWFVNKPSKLVMVIECWDTYSIKVPFEFRDINPSKIGEELQNYILTN